MNFYYSRRCMTTLLLNYFSLRLSLTLLLTLSLMTIFSMAFAESGYEHAFLENDVLEFADSRSKDSEGAEVFKRRSDRSLSCSAWKKRLSWLSRRQESRRQQSRMAQASPNLSNVPYGTQSLQTLDIYFPTESSMGHRQNSQQRTILMMVHGGGWCVGDKAMSGVVTNKLAWAKRHNMIFISVNYPMVDEGSDAIAQANHIAEALYYAQQHAHDWGGDSQHVILMGHSAGAHLVSLVNASEQLRRQHDLRPWLATISLDAGAIDVVKQMPQVYPFLKQRYLEAFGPSESTWKRASPYHQLSAGATPWLGVCSTKRKDQPCAQAENYVQKSKSFGMIANVLPLSLQHGEINNQFGLENSYTRDVERFLSLVLPQQEFMF